MANREILFRGKRTDDGKWETGFLIGRYDPLRKENIIKRAYIDNGTCFYSPVEVIPETVGQYTGLADKNGKKIFEGDILTYPDSSCFGVVCFGDYDGFDTHHTGFFVKWFENGKQKGFRRDIRFWTMDQEAWVVGNIHDNPELLKGGNQE